MMSIKALEQERDALHAELHALLAQYKPKEGEIRSKIKALNEQITLRTMGPKIAAIGEKIKNGDATDAESRKYKIWSSHLESLQA
jgi:hypothetical protein